MGFLACQALLSTPEGMAVKSLCLLALGALFLLQGCSTDQEELENGKQLERVAEEDLSDDSVVAVTAAMEALVVSPDSADAKKDLQKALTDSGLLDFLDGATEEMSARVEDGLLKVNLTMKPLKVVGGLISLRRAKGDHRGATFAIHLPLLENTKLSPSAIGKDMLRARGHMEGYAYVALFCYGHFKMLMNHLGKKFHMEFTKLKIFDLVDATGIISVGKDNVVTASGELKSWFTKEFAEKVAEEITNVAQPLADLVEKEKQKNNCGGIVGAIGCGLLDVAKAVIGGAAEGVAFIVEHVGKLVSEIFTLKTAEFEVTLDANSGNDTRLELDFAVTVLGKDKSAKATVDLSDLHNAAIDVAKMFAPEIFAESERQKIR